MRSFYLVLAFIFIQKIQILGQISSEKQYVILNLNDCINCNTFLQTYLEDNKLLEKTIVLQEEFLTDSLEIIKLFRLYDRSHYSIVFSDSLYNRYIGNNYKSKIIYLDQFNNVKYTQILQEYISNPIKKNDSFSANYCFDPVKNYYLYRLFVPSFLVQYKPQFKKYVIHTLNEDNKNVTLIADSSWLREGYMALLGNKYKEEYYEQMLSVGQFYPGVQSHILELDILDRKPYILYNVPIGKYDSTYNATVIYNKYLLREFDMQSQTYLRSIPISDDTLTKMDYYISSSFMHLTSIDTLYLSVRNDKEPIYYTMARFVLKDDKYYKFAGFLNYQLPEIYNEKELNDFTEKHVFKNEYIAVSHSTYIYDYVDDIKYFLPISDEEIENLSNKKNILKQSIMIDSNVYYSIIDIGVREGQFDVLYRSPIKGYQISSFKKGNSQPIATIGVEISPDIKYVFLHDEKRKLLLLKKDEGCVEEMDY